MVDEETPPDAANREERLAKRAARRQRRETRQEKRDLKQSSGATISRDLDARRETLVPYFFDPDQRARWLNLDLEVTRAGESGHSIRFIIDGNWQTRVGFFLVNTSNGQTAIQVQQVGLDSMEAVAQTQQFWNERLDALMRLVNPDS